MRPEYTYKVPIQKTPGHIPQRAQKTWLLVTVLKAIPLVDMANTPICLWKSAVEIELLHDKTKEITQCCPMHPLKTQISLGMCPGWSESLMVVWRQSSVLTTLWIQLILFTLKRLLWLIWKLAEHTNSAIKKKRFNHLENLPIWFTYFYLGDKWNNSPDDGDAWYVLTRQTRRLHIYSWSTVRSCHDSSWWWT